MDIVFLLIFFAAAWFAFVAWRKKGDKKGAAIAGLVALVAFAGVGITHEPDEEDEPETEEVAESDDEEPEETAEPEEEPQEEPVLTDDIFQEVVDFMEEEEMVQDAHVGLYEDDTQIRIVLQVNHATNEEHAEDLADSAIRWLASQASQHPDNELDTPSNEYLGELYDYYDLRVGVGTSADNFIYSAQKNTTHDNLRPASF